MDTFTCLVAGLLLITVSLPACTAAPSLQPQEWVTVSRCRLQCVNKFLFASGQPLTEDQCMGDAGGCFECWKICENLLAKPLEFEGVCDATYDANAEESEPDAVDGSEEDYTCTVGCYAACDAHTALDKRFYASADQPLLAEPVVDFYNASAMFIDIAAPSEHAYVYVVLYSMTENSEDWTQLLSTFQQPIPVYGKFSNYPGLQLRVLTVAPQGVTGDATLNLYELAAMVPEPSTTSTTSTTSAEPATTRHTGASAHATSTPMPGSAEPSAPTTLNQQNEYQLMFNHYIDLLSAGEPRARAPVDTPASSATSNIIVYISVAVACILVLVVIIVGIVVLRSNNQLAKSLSRRASTFRTSFRRSMRRSVRGFRGQHLRYDLARAAEAGYATTIDDANATSDATVDANMQPMVVPLLCVSTPNLHAANLLNVSPLKLQTTSLTNIHAVNQSDAPLATPDLTPDLTDVTVTSPEVSTESDSIVILTADNAEDSNC